MVQSLPVIEREANLILGFKAAAMVICPMKGKHNKVPCNHLISSHVFSLQWSMK